MSSGAQKIDELWPSLRGFEQALTPVFFLLTQILDKEIVKELNHYHLKDGGFVSRLKPSKEKGNNVLIHLGNGGFNYL